MIRGRSMKKIDPTVLRETRFIAIWVLLFSVILQSVFLIIGKWNYTVLLGNLLSGSVAILNFLLMGITVQKAVLLEERDAKNTVRASQALRNIFLFIVAAVGVLLPCFSNWTVIIPLLFPRIAIILRPLFNKKLP